MGCFVHGAVVGDGDPANPNPVLARYTGTSYATNYNERVLYTGTIPANSNGTPIPFRLRMWVAENADFTPTDTVVAAHCSDNSQKDYATCIASSVNTWDGSACSNTEYDNETECLSEKLTWVEQQVNQTYPLNGKTFTVTINVYADGQMVSQNVTIPANEVAYTNAAAPGITTVAGALDDLTEKLGG